MLLSLTMVATAGLLVVGGTQLIRQPTTQPLIAKLMGVKVTSDSNPDKVNQRQLANVTTQVARTAVLLEERYQQAFQRRIDRLFSGTRHAQWEEIAGGDSALEITPMDKMFNRRIAGLSVVVVTAALAKLYQPFLWITIPFAFLELIGHMGRTAEDIKHTRRLKMEDLMVPFIAGLWYTGYFFVGGLMLLTYHFIMKITLQSQDRTRKEMVNILGEQPRLVWVLVNGVEMELPFEQLQVGDTLVVQAGQMIPVDGVITQGEATIDQHRLTGESQPVEKGVGASVSAATVVLSGRTHIRVEKTGEATLAAQISEILDNTLEYHLGIEERGREIADSWMIPSIMTTGLAAMTLGIKSAVSVLGTMPGIDMMFLGPISLLNYLNLASRQNVLIKDGRSLELLRHVDTIIFDKTGTLTEEQPQVKTIHRPQESTLSEDRILTIAAAAEQRQGHPIAKAILAAANEQGLGLPPVDDAHYELGYGLRVWLSEDDEHGTKLLARVGSLRFMEMESVSIPTEIMDIQTACHELGHSLVMVAIEGKLVGAIELQPTIRAEACEVIAALHKRNLSTAIISGDQEAPTRTLANELGIDRYFANVLPEEKAAFVAQLQTEGKTVCFVGDGINDAIALKKAEVSISLRGATTIATDTAQIVLMDQTLQALPALFDLSHELERNLMTSLAIVTVPCCFIIGGIFFFNVGLPAAMTAYTATFIAGVANAMSPIVRNRLSDEDIAINEEKNDEPLKIT
ncbi:MAG: heavy metal translocating P-type ATPase [Chloroflexota bacterium]